MVLSDCSFSSFPIINNEIVFWCKIGTYNYLLNRNMHVVVLPLACSPSTPAVS